ncbi:BTAD domain-containing putative transcriptional regulator [Dactylosporangium sp. NPDC049525]|uniref:ATP-binding protein n=1 Tax=Dactylosporangium sp. NPDC049525 TaxID=3154730 RepID=UPI0034437045
MTVELILLGRVAYRGREIVGPRQCGLLALLAGDLRTGCGTARLVDGLWPDERPEHPAKALQVIVSRARAQAGADIIVRTAVGYRLAVPAAQVDTSAALLHAAEAAELSRAENHGGALASAEAGLALWAAAEPGDPGLADPLSALRAELEETRQSLRTARALALSRLGRHAEAVGPLAELAGRRPRDEAVLLELLRCEAATAGPPAALARYETYRKVLRDELGADPGQALQEAHRQLLRDEAPAVRSGVPHDPNPLLGRDDDIAAVTALLTTARVTSVVGTGGLGKTRLAYAVSRQARQPVVHLVALAGVAADADVAQEVAASLGATGDAATAVTAIVDALGAGPALLVLDNCEHVVGGVADLVGSLVSATRDLRVLTTSRAPLGLSSESVYPLPELRLDPTVELFLQRARAARPGADLPAGPVRDLCTHLDGLPLAVELAAARVRVMSVTEIARGLDDRFALLRGGARDAPLRHRTLHAVIDWSWNLLEPSGRAAMRALSVFPGGFTAGAARHVLGDGDVVAVLTQLADQSLLKVTDTGAGTRFRMLETVREFSTAHRERAGETGRAVDGLLAWAREFGAAHAGSVFGADLIPATERIRVEQDNLMLALRHGLDRADGPTVAAAAAVLAGLWSVEGNFLRMTALTKDAAWVLSHTRPTPETAEATHTAVLLCAMNDMLMRATLPRRLLATLRRLPVVPPGTLMGAADTVVRTLIEDLDGLRALCDSDEPLLAGVANGAASYIFEQQHDLEAALQAARRMLAAFGGWATPWMRAVAHSRVGELCLQAGHGEEGAVHLAETLAVLDGLRQPGVSSSASRVRGAMALASLQRGALDEAEHWLEHAGEGDVAADMYMFGTSVRAEILLARGDVDGGLQLWRQVADQLRDPAGVPRELPGSLAWAMEVQAAAVLAHAQHGRLDLVRDIAGDLPDLLSRLLAGPGDGTDVGDPIRGALLLALAAVDLERGRRTGDGRVTASAARMTALAACFRFMREFQPTMPAAYAQLLAELSATAAYAAAVAAYAGLDRDELRGAASAALQERRGLTTAETG